jgi:acetylornithine deacetylase/succinyl-diaminopimelate desuccinylase-like protein
MPSPFSTLLRAARAVTHRATEIRRESRPLARGALLRSAFAGVALTTCAARPGSPAPAAANAAPTQAEQAVIAETRTTLTTLVAVDTSHGHETALLRPVAERFRAAGLPVELVESAEGRGNLVARYKGNGKKRPLLLIAHVDVVPIEGQPWTVPPFQITEKEGFLMGRGVNDDKGMAAAVIAIALEMARTKPVLSRDVIFALTAGEETGGAPGARWLAANRKDLIDAEIALNEGAGERLDDAGERILQVGIGVAEKTFQDYKVVVRGKGGHSSIPPTDSDPVLTLARALVKIAEFRFPAHVIPAVREELAAEAKLDVPPLSTAEGRVAVTGQVTAEDEGVVSKDRVVNAHLRTTCVTTQLVGSPQDNVLPTSAEATVNCRILPDETPAQTLATLRQVVGDPGVDVQAVGDFGFGPYSPVEGEVPAAMKRMSARLWPGAPVVATMSAGATDSRHLRAIGIHAYGIGVSPISKPEALAGRSAHGPDERRPAKWLADGVRFLRNVTYELAR